MLKKMLDLKQLHDLSKKELEGMLSEELLDFRLEQAEHSDENDTWDIVVSFLTKNLNVTEGGGINSALALRLSPYERVYKRMLLDTNGRLLKYLIYKA